MTLSKRLVAASANRMISFYDLTQTNYKIPVSRIENLVGIPLCLEYYRWPKENDNRLETLLVGDDLGICHMYNFTSLDWHYCQYKLGSKDHMNCHKPAIEKEYDNSIQYIYDQMQSKKGKKKKDVKEEEKTKQVITEDKARALKASIDKK